MLSVQTKRHIGPLSFKSPFRSGAASDFNTSSFTAAFLQQELLRTYDFVGVGVAIMTAEGRLLHHNATAERILAEHDGIELASSGSLRLGLRNASVTQAIAKCSRGSETPGVGHPQPLAILAVPRPSGKRPLTVLAGPYNMAPMLVDQDAAAVLLFIIDPELSRKGMDQYARQVFGLTPAETDLASLLLRGKSLVECCEQMEIRRPTAATHLRRLFHKTNTKTQSQLVSLLFRRCGMLCSATRSNNDALSTLHLVSRASEPLSRATTQKVVQPHSFGGRH